MDQGEYNTRSKILFEAINDLALHSYNMEDAEARKGLIEVIDSLKPVYADGVFRHKYSEFFPIISRIYTNKEFNSGYFLANLSAVETLIIDEKYNEEENFRKGVLKLVDHLNLEASRIEENQRIQGELISAQEVLDDTKEQLHHAEEKLQKAEEKIEASKTELVAILSIFAAIVFAFSGGVSLLGGAFASLADAPLLKTALIALICGFILFNIIFFLMYIVSRIVRKSIYTRCNTKDCNCDVESDKPIKCGGLKRVRKRLTYAFYTNIVIIGLILINIGLIVLDNYIHFMPY